MSLYQGDFKVRGITFFDKAFSKEYIEGIVEGKTTPERLDALVCTPPRAGTMRLLEIVWFLKNDCNFEEARTVEIRQRHNFLEFLSNSNRQSPLGKTHFSYDFCENLVKTKQPKVVVGFRNPKDILVSFFYFHKIEVFLGPIEGTWDDFFEAYKQGELVYGCPIEWMANWWPHRNDPNVLIVKFEDFEKHGGKETVGKIAEFFDFKDEKLIEGITQEVAFDTMKQSSSRTYSNILKEGASYLRRGKIGGWKELFTQEQSEFIDRKCRELCLPIGLTFDFE